MRRLVIFGVVALLAAGIWYLNDSRAGGVQGRGIKIGKSASGVLTAEDPTLRGRGPYQLWSVRGKRGRRVTIDMTSSSFDAFLILRGPDGFVMAANDDGGDDNNARINTIFPRTATYTIVAAAYASGMRGDYGLTIGEWVVPDVPGAGEPQSLAMGATRDGLLEPGDEVTGDGPFQDRWSFDMPQDGRFRLEMRSTDIDSYLILLGPDGAQLATNDDGSGRDAIITMKAPAAGRYTALATTFGDQPNVGAYRVALSEVTGAIGATPVEVRLGETREGMLESGDSTSASGSFADLYHFRPAAGRVYQIDLVSAALDPYLTLQDSLGNQLATDDDGGDEGLNSRLRYIMQAGQLYRIVAGTFGSSGRSGSYRISVNPAP